MKKSLLFLLVLSLMMSSLSALAQESAESIAKAFLPEDAVLRSSETDDGLLELEFNSNAFGAVYSVKMMPNSLEVLYLESDTYDDKCGREVLITPEEVVALTVKDNTDPVIEGVFLQDDDGKKFYVVVFTSKTHEGLVISRFDASDARLFEMKVLYGLSNDETSSFEEIANAVASSMEGAVVGGSVEMKNNTLLYEVDVYADGEVYEITIDPKTADILKTEISDDVIIPVQVDAAQK